MKMNFKDWLETSLATGINEPPTYNYTDDDGEGDDEQWWNEKSFSLLWKWAEKSEYFKKCVSLLSGLLLKEPVSIQPSTHVVSFDGGYSRLDFEWILKTEGFEFDNFEIQIKQILLKSDLWKYMNIPSEKAFNVMETEFIDYFLQSFCTMGLTATALYPQIKFATYQLIHDDSQYNEEVLNLFIDSYNNRYYKSPKSIDDFNYKLTEMEAKYLPRWRNEELVAVGTQRYSIKVT